MIEYCEKAVQSEHDEGDDDAHDDAGTKDARGHANGKEHDDQAPGEEPLMMQNVETFGDDGAGGVSVSDGAEGSRGGDGKEEESAEPHDESQPDQRAQQGFHARQGTACSGLRARNPWTGAIGNRRNLAFASQPVSRYSGGL